MTGKLRVGVPDDHGRAKLADIIATFTCHHPKIELDVTCALSTEFPDALDDGSLDLAIYEVDRPKAHEEVLFEDPTCWVSSAHRNFSADKGLPVALFDHACWWRDAAISSLKARGKPYRIVYSCRSVSGVIAVVEAGIAVGLLGRSSLHSGLSDMGKLLGFRNTLASKLVMASKGAHCGPLRCSTAIVQSNPARAKYASDPNGPL